MKHSLHKRLIGSVASLAAAYALVLNVVLSSMLLASLSPTALAAGTEICAASAVYGIAHDNVGQSDADQAPGAVAAHCPVCVFAHLPGTPLPSGIFLIARNAVAVAPIPVLARIAAAGPDTSAHSPRAPPQAV